MAILTWLDGAAAAQSRQQARRPWHHDCGADNKRGAPGITTAESAGECAQLWPPSASSSAASSARDRKTTPPHRHSVRQGIAAESTSDIDSFTHTDIDTFTTVGEQIYFIGITEHCSL